MSLARGPVLFTGAVLFVFGLLGLLVNADLPRDQFADGTVVGESWLGIEVNGWTNFFALAGGGLLLFGAAQHTLARVTALLVGGAFAACCVIALIDGEDVLGLAAVNWATKLGFGVVAGVLLIAALLPRRERDVDLVADAPVATAAEPETREVVREEPVVVREEPVVGEEPVAREEPVTRQETVRVEQSTPLVAQQGGRGARPTTAPERTTVRRRPGLGARLRKLTRR